ncbi:hypothetical protein BDZ85DRAFT_258489 [Elsinoe ampelina]|uniref:Protection of telomeres protein 1 n=1 Tax=Elsinoe ampelina TaxID=302913 RepID=A0A6A6GK59_9PEZI|nr:hypothetical protein BDZ85DRAFT_258489 [Elsinoe ampelina]
MVLQSCELPKGYTGVSVFLNDHSQVFATVAGFVTDVMPPIKTKNGAGDWMLTFSICDVDLMLHNGNWSGTKVRFFRGDEKALPQPELGDIVLLRNMKKTTFAGNLILIAHQSANFVVFSRNHIPSPAFASQYQAGITSMPSTFLHPRDAPKYDEQWYAMTLKQEYDDQIQGYVTASSRSLDKLSLPSNRGLPGRPPDLGTAAANAPTGPRQKFALIKDMQVNGFYDMIVEVIKIFPTPYDYLEAYVSDYTTNKLLYDYPTPEEQRSNGRDGDEFGYMDETKKRWQGPWGQTVLKIEVKAPHSIHLQRNVQERQYARLSNVRVKLSRQSKLEGNLWPDNNWPDKMLVEKINPAAVDVGRALMERRAQYWAKRKSDDDSAPKEVKKAKTKRASAKQKAREQAAAEQKLAEEPMRIPGVESNKHVRTSNPDVPLTTIASLLSSRGHMHHKDRDEIPLPFINQKRRCQVRVVDFYPPRLEDFSTDQVQIDNDTQSRSDYEMDLDQHSWSWDFYLLVEDAIRAKSAPKDSDVPRLWLHVSNADAQYLFREIKEDACNLRENAAMLDQLRQQTDIIWGNLAELKTAAEGDPQVNSVEKDYWSAKLSNLPFDCCIQEYGQPVEADDENRLGPDSRGWIRLFSLCETMVL